MRTEPWSRLTQLTIYKMMEESVMRNCDRFSTFSIGMFGFLTLQTKLRGKYTRKTFNTKENGFANHGRVLHVYKHLKSLIRVLQSSILFFLSLFMSCCLLISPFHPLATSIYWIAILFIKDSEYNNPAFHNPVIRFQQDNNTHTHTHKKCVSFGVLHREHYQSCANIHIYSPYT